jgi:hypothetical protein
VDPRYKNHIIFFDDYQRRQNKHRLAMAAVIKSPLSRQVSNSSETGSPQTAKNASNCKNSNAEDPIALFLSAHSQETLERTVNSSQNDEIETEIERFFKVLSKRNLKFKITKLRKN